VLDEALLLPRLTADALLVLPAASCASSALSNCEFELPARDVLALLLAALDEALDSNEDVGLDGIVPMLII